MTDTAPASMRPEFASDADLTHPWVSRWRIPMVPSPYPVWAYEVALVVPDPSKGYNLYGSVMPTEDEARVLGSYIDYRRAWYREGYAAKMLERPLDVDGGTNTVILVKTETGWRYRLASFTQGGLFPAYDEPEFQALFPPTRDGLMALIVKINSITDCPYERFMTWMETHSTLWDAVLPAAREAVAADKAQVAGGSIATNS